MPFRYLQSISVESGEPAGASPIQSVGFQGPSATATVMLPPAPTVAVGETTPFTVKTAVDAVTVTTLLVASSVKPSFATGATRSPPR
ncbi:MAG: hypothetical protein K2Y23_00090 [Cyanobacteria bacterium]|nr:hypothetical protein [Cyanobacteriota bacterium]